MTAAYKVNAAHWRRKGVVRVQHGVPVMSCSVVAPVISGRRVGSRAASRADRLLKRLKAARLDATYEQELRRLIRVDLLILDDFALEAMDTVETHDFYQVVVERHRRSSTILTSNREPIEWLPLMADPMLAQSAVDRIVNSAYELVLEGESYRSRQKPGRRS